MFTKIGTDVRTNQNKNEFFGVTIEPPLLLFCPQTPILLGEEVMKIHANSKQSYIALNVRE